MSKIAALCYFVLSLYGCDIGTQNYVNRTTADGREALHSRATVQAGVARFECVRSASGRCHYAVFDRDDCVAAPREGRAAPAGCVAEPVERFALAAGDSRHVPGLTGFRLCVGTDAAGARADCTAGEAVAAR
jgi:hypothetical protein